MAAWLERRRQFIQRQMVGGRPFFIAAGVVLLLTILVAVLGACDQLDEPPVDGIVQTDVHGTVIQDDPDDWQPRCGSATPSCVTPLSPNPVDMGRTTSLAVTLGRNAFVAATIEDPSGRMLDDTEGRHLDRGTFELALNPTTEAGYAEGTYRVVISAYDARGSLLLRTFGDLAVESAPSPE